MIWAINDRALKHGVYYHDVIDAIALISAESWFIVGAKNYPLSGWKRIGKY